MSRHHEDLAEYNDQCRRLLELEVEVEHLGSEARFAFARGYRAGIEAAAVVAETGREKGDPADGYRSTIMVDMDGDEIAAAIRALPVPEQGAAEPTCMDCREPYSSARFPDLVIDDAAWKAIAPDDGLLCPCCINARLERAGLTDVHARFRSGPMAIYETTQPTAEEPTEEEVEREAVAIYESMRAEHEIDWAAEEERLRDCYRHTARAALIAARSRI